MKVVLGIPFRDPDGTRKDALSKMLPYLESIYLWDRISIRDSDPTKPFFRSQARNRIVSENTDADVVVICDADSVPQEWSLKKAIESAAYSFVCHFPFNVVRDLSELGTQLAEFPMPLESLPSRQEYGPSEGGCWVIRPEAWMLAGGQEERLSGWGQEDRIFLITSHTMLGKSVIHPGILHTFHHPRHGLGFNEQDKLLFEEYEQMYLNRPVMQEYLNSRRNNV